MSFDRLVIAETKNHFRKLANNEVANQIEEIELKLLRDKKEEGQKLGKEVLLSVLSDSEILKDLLE